MTTTTVSELYTASLPPWTTSHGAQTTSSHGEALTTPMLTTSVLTTSVLTTLLCLLSALCVAVNLGLVVVVARTPALRTPTNAGLVSLAVSDCISGLVLIPASVQAALHPPPPADYSDRWSCQLLAALGEVRRCSTLLGLLLVTLDRCVAVTWPLRYSRLVTPPAVAVCLAAAWTLSALLALLPPVTGLGRYMYSRHKLTCALCWDAHYAVLYHALTTLLPLTLIALLLAAILRAGLAHRRVAVMLPVPAGLALALGRPAPPARPVNYRRSTLRAMTTLFVVIATLLLLWSPLYVLDLYRLLSSHRHSPLLNSLVTMATVLYHTSAVVNPLVFLTNKKYKQRLRELLCVGSRRLCQGAGSQEAGGYETRPTSSTAVPPHSPPATPAPHYEPVSVAHGSTTRTLYINTKASTLAVPTYSPAPSPLPALRDSRAAPYKPRGLPTITVTSYPGGEAIDWVAPNAAEIHETAGEVSIRVPHATCNLSTI